VAHVALKDVGKTYEGDTPAVQEVSFEVEDREFLVIVGPSGCGKSTILRLVAGLEELTSGTIEIDGRVVNDVAPKDRDIAMVFQNYALYPHMTVKENLAFGLRMKKRPKDEIAESVGEAARLLGLEWEGTGVEAGAVALAQGVRQAWRSSHGLAIVGDETDRAWVALASDSGVDTRRLRFQGRDRRARTWTTTLALEFVRRVLLGLADGWAE